MPERIEFQREIDRLHKDLVKMGSLIEEQIDDMIEALLTQNIELAEAVIAKDDVIDEMERKVERDGILLIARQQPIASDLRDVASVLKIITDLERIADHCEDISTYVINLSNAPHVKPIEHIPEMANEIKKMVKATIDGCISKDIEVVKQVIEMDDVIDDYFRIIVDELVRIMENDPSTVKQCKDFLFIVKYLERMGDHAENIAEWMVYAITGDHLLR